MEQRGKPFVQPRLTEEASLAEVTLKLKQPILTKDRDFKRYQTLIPIRLLLEEEGA